MNTDPLVDAAACERAAVYAYREGNMARHEWLTRRAQELRALARGRRPARPPTDDVTDGDGKRRPTG